uniref:Uncharacterized protein n=1 Tax=Oryza sativa subsp. indica TaxID=39946 RepID=A0A679B9X5_ORYSI|nr:hypothetical protein [Oryza sativa Indica Group]
MKGEAELRWIDWNGNSSCQNDNQESRSYVTRKDSSQNEAFDVRSRNIAGLKEDGEFDNSADGMNLLLCCGKEERIHLFPSCMLIVIFQTKLHIRQAISLDISVIFYGNFPKR